MVYMYTYTLKNETKVEEKKCSIFFFGSDGIRTHDFHVTGSIGQNIAICDAKMLPSDHGDFFNDEA